MERGQAPGKEGAAKEPVKSGEGRDGRGDPAGDAQKKSAGAGSAPSEEGIITPEPSRSSLLEPEAAGPGPREGTAGRRGTRWENYVPEGSEEDPALTGPLGLRNDAQADEVFLKGVMEKLAGVEGKGGGDEGKR